MARKLQHITTADLAEAAGRDGKKVKTLCGERVYRMPNMKDEIPTCTPCVSALRDEYNALARRAPVYTYYFSSSSNTTFTAAS